MHVYATGAEADGYRVITLRIEPQPYIRFMPVEYPVSETYLFEPLDEVEPVYLDRFILRQDIVLEATRQTEAALRLRQSLVPDDIPQAELALSGTLILRGTLDYQACDDSICLSPVSVPLSWTVRSRRSILSSPTSPLFAADEGVMSKGAAAAMTCIWIACSGRRQGNEADHP